MPHWFVCGDGTGSGALANWECVGAGGGAEGSAGWIFWGLGRGASGGTGRGGRIRFASSVASLPCFGLANGRLFAARMATGGLPAAWTGGGLPGCFHNAGDGSESATLYCLGGFGERVDGPSGLIEYFKIAGPFVDFANFVGGETTAGAVQHAGENDLAGL